MYRISGGLKACTPGIRKPYWIVAVAMIVPIRLPQDLERRFLEAPVFDRAAKTARLVIHRRAVVAVHSVLLPTCEKPSPWNKLYYRGTVSFGFRRALCLLGSHHILTACLTMEAIRSM